MALDDRDRSFEKALARHLRYIAPGGADSGASASMPCPDPEILAAYHDGFLGSEERELWKQHVLACDRCQLVLEHLATPLDVPIGQQTAEETLSSHAASSERTEPQTVASPSRAAAPAPVIAIRPRKMYLRWLVPAGAIAAVLLVVVVVENSRSVFRRVPEQIQVANTRQPAPSPVGTSNPAAGSAEQKQAAAAETRSKEPAESAETTREKDQFAASSARGAGSASGAALDAGALAKERGLRNQRATQAANQFASTRAHGPALSAQQQQRQQSMPPALLGGPPFDAKKAKEESDAQLVEEGKALASKLPPPTPPSSVPENQPSFLADESVNRRSADAVPSAPKPTAAARARSGAAGGATPAAASQTVTVESSAGALIAVRADAISSGPIVRAPSGDVVWRVGAAGSIEHSTDGGATWSEQSSGVNSNLTTGFALSPKVCWVVGASGTILRTIDGGAHWIKISSPVADDLIGVRSTDAFHATIWFVDDPKAGTTKSFKTDDGGIHWSPATND